jgi:acetyltransferase-like isoleucine patch superfamily enzyme
MWLFYKMIGKEGQKVWKRLKKVNSTNLNPKNYASAGEHCNIGYEQTSVPKNIYLEDFCRIQNHFNFISYKGKLIVKKYAAIGAGCIIIPGDHVPTVGVPQYLAGKLHINDVDGEIVIGEDAWVGAGTILLSHCQIGRGAVVAAGAVVSKPVPPYAVVAGVPAKIIATRFTIEQILEHESTLYPKEERMSREVLEKLFDENFQGKRSIGKSEMNTDDKARLLKAKEKFGIPIYSK